MNDKVEKIDKTIEFLTRFIEIYHYHPALWKVKSKEYVDKKLKEAGYLHLLQHYKTADETATVDTVKRKINNLRCSFRKELKKARASINRVYIPTLWYYNILSFIADQEDARKSRGPDGNCSDENGYSENENSEIEMEKYITKTEPCISENSHSISSVTPINYSEIQDQPTQLIYSESNHSNKRKINHQSPTLQTYEYNDEKKDECDIIGANVAFKLRRMDSNQMLLAEHIINSVLFHGLQNNLSASSHLQI